MWKIKKMDFLQNLPDTICVRQGEKTRILVHTICFGQNFFWPKTVQTRKHYKNSGFSGNCPKPKMTLFFGKRCFLKWVKKWVLLTVFLKSCVFFSENTIFIMFSEKHSSCNTNTVCKQKQKIEMINSGLFWAWQKGVFLFVSFPGFNVIVFFVW